MQVQVVNVGNTLIKGLEVTVTNVTDLDCKWGLQSATDADVLASANVTNSTTTEIGPLEKVVCVGTFIFDQAALDVNQNSMVFTPTVVTTSNDTKDTSAPSGYTATASVPIAAVPALVLTVNATACEIPSIIPAGEQSECGKRQGQPLLLAGRVLSCANSNTSFHSRCTALTFLATHGFQGGQVVPQMLLGGNARS
jgi:hypothetical protein